MRFRKWSLPLVVLHSLSWWCGAEVIDSASQGFTVRNTVQVLGSPQQAYSAFVQRVGSWWSPEHTFFGDSSKLEIEARVQGCFCERSEGREVRHLTVIFVEPGKQIKLSGGLGPLQDHPVSGVMTVLFSPAESGAEVEMIYRVSGYLKDGLEGWAGPVDSVLAQQLVRFREHLNAQ